MGELERVSRTQGPYAPGGLSKRPWTPPRDGKRRDPKHARPEGDQVELHLVEPEDPVPLGEAPESEDTLDISA